MIRRNPRPKSVEIDIQFNDGKETKYVRIATATGCNAKIYGDMYPVELKLINDVVAVLRKLKDNYPTIPAAETNAIAKADADE